MEASNKVGIIRHFHFSHLLFLEVTEGVSGALMSVPLGLRYRGRHITPLLLKIPTTPMKALSVLCFLGCEMSINRTPKNIDPRHSPHGLLMLRLASPRLASSAPWIGPPRPLRGDDVPAAHQSPSGRHTGLSRQEANLDENN